MEIQDDKAIIRVTELEHSFVEGEGRVHALRGVSFDCKAGEVTAVVGPSGCGKSTLLYLLGLLDRPDRGEIYLRENPSQRQATKPEHICETKKSALSFNFTS